MRTSFSAIAAIATLTFNCVTNVAHAAAMNVFACEPEWGALVTQIAGDEIQLTVATTAFQDPHRIEAKPSLIARARNADLLICSGAELEVGWLPLLIRRAGNPRIAPGASGHFMAADHVRRLEMPTQINRSQGDVHPQGNPHVHLNPNNISRIAGELAKRLAQLSPHDAELYTSNLEMFLARWEVAIADWEKRMAPLAGVRFVPMHKSFTYLADWLDLDMTVTVEAKPGIPPSGKHLASLLDRLSTNPPAAVIRTPYANEKPSLWLARQLGVPHITLPYTIGGSEAASDLFNLFEATIGTLESIQP